VPTAAAPWHTCAELFAPPVLSLIPL